MVNPVNSLVNLAQANTKHPTSRKASKNGDGFQLESFGVGVQNKGDPSNTRTPRPVAQKPTDADKLASKADTPDLDPTDDDIVVSHAASMSVMDLLALMMPQENVIDPEAMVDTLSELVSELNLDHDPALQDLLQQLQALIDQNNIQNPLEARTPQDISTFDRTLHDAVDTIKELLQEDPASLYIILEKEPFTNIKPLFVNQGEEASDTLPVSTMAPLESTGVQPVQETLGSDTDTRSQNDADANAQPDTSLMPPAATFAERLPDAIAPPAQQQDIEAFRASLFEHAIAQVTSTVQSGQQTMTIQLRPEFLGSMTLQLMMTEQGLTAKLGTSDPHVQTMMAEQLSQLQLQLQERGINVVHMEVIYNQMQDSRFQQDASADTDQTQQQSTTRPNVVVLHNDNPQSSVSIYDAIAASSGSMEEVSESLELLV